MDGFYLSKPEASVFFPLIDTLREKLSRAGIMLATAESCTGGLIAALCTDMAGSSRWFSGGIVAYSDFIKEQALGVPRVVLLDHGAVSEAVVRQMAIGALGACGAGISVAVSGIAGPDGGSPQKPVGTVWIAWALAAAKQPDQAPAGQLLSPPRVRAERFFFHGTRPEVRLATAKEALLGLSAMLP